MRSMRVAVAARSFALLAALLALGGCGTFRSYDSELRNTVDLAGNGRVDSAIKTLQSHNKSKNKDLLYYFELGELQRMVDRYPDSQATWMEANRRVADWEAQAKVNPEKVAANVGSVLLNDRVRPYEGHDYEKVMLTTRMALNFLSMGDFDNARVAITQTHERETVIANVRAKEVAEVERDARSRGAASSVRELNGYPVQSIDNPQVNALKNSYQNALSHYLAGFIYESQGEGGLAAPGYRIANELQPHQPLLEDALRGLDQRLASPDDSRTDTLFVIETGTAPARESRGFPLPIPVNRTLILIPISFPVMNETSNPGLPQQLRVDSSESLSIAGITNIDLMARRALKDDMPGIILRATIRSASKAVAQYQLQHEAQRRENLLLGIGALAFTLGSVITEQADERTWRMLPAQIGIARARLTPGTHNITVQTLDGPRTTQVTVSGRYAVVGLRLLRRELFVEAPALTVSARPPQATSTPNAPATLQGSSPQEISK